MFARAATHAPRRLVHLRAFSAQRRLDLWEEACSLDRQQAVQQDQSFTVHLADNQSVSVTGTTNSTTPRDLLDQGDGVLPDHLRANALIATVDNGVVWDLSRPLEAHVTELVFHDFASSVGRETLWHSSAHLLGAALEELKGDQLLLSDGPPLDASHFDASAQKVAPGTGGFFYDFYQPPGSSIVTPQDFTKLKKTMNRMVKKKHKFERVQVTPQFALEMFHDNPFKQHILARLPEDSTITLYRTGKFIDLCRGPHIEHTGKIGKAAVDVLQCSSSQYTPPGDGAEPQALERVYGISFPSSAQLKDWTQRTEDAKAFDHRKLGKHQDLFMFHSYSPGSAFFLPRGTVIFQRLIDMIREEYATRGYEEVITPLIYSHDLWSQSGHLDNYQSNMYAVVAGEADPVDALENASCGDRAQHVDQSGGNPGIGLKPMNCPGHCLLFKSASRSYRELPMRIADFSPLHRNELSGTLGGLTRLRRFHQDDAHIFCTMEQVQREILDCLQFVHYVYNDLFGFSYKLRLSTRPEKAIGDEQTWSVAEQALRDALAASGEPWTTDEGEGAFYGPKIDITITDAMARDHQCATIQLDFQLPSRFELEYSPGGTDNVAKQPVMVHRAILGSLERFMGILLEHTKGKLPFWLSPRQVMVLPVNYDHLAYANEVCGRIRGLTHDDDAWKGKTEAEQAYDPVVVAKGVCTQVEEPNNTLRKRILTAQRAPYSLMLILGDKEMETRSVTFRSNDNKISGTMPLDEFLDACKASCEGRENAMVPQALASYMTPAE